MMEEKSILIADYYAIARSGLREVLKQEEGCDVVGEAVNGFDAVVKAKQLQPDLVILNGSMPRLSGLEAARRIKAQMPDTRILVLVGQSDRELMKAISGGIVDGVALHSDSALQLLTCVRKVLHAAGFAASDFFPPPGK